MNVGWATKYTVTTTAVDNKWFDKCLTDLSGTWFKTLTPGSFTDAIHQANAGKADTIVFAASLTGQTINMSTAPENSRTLCAAGVVVDGKDAPGMTLQGPNDGPALIVTGDNSRIQNLQFSTTAQQRGGLEYQANNSFVDNCIFLQGNLYIGHIRIPAVYVTGNIITNCDIQNGNLQIMGASNQIKDTKILGELVIGDEGGTKVLSNKNILTNCTGISKGAFIYGNENEIINAVITVTAAPDISGLKPHGIVIKGNTNTIKKSSISNTLPVDNDNDFSGIRIEDPLSFDNVIDSTTIDGWWNGVYIKLAEKNTASNNNIINSQNAGVLIDQEGNNNTITGNIIDKSIKNGIQLNANEGNIITKNESKNSVAANGISLISTIGKNTLTENAVYGNAGNGIYLFGAKDTEVTKNFLGQSTDGSVIKGNQVGITISEGGSGNIIDGNTIVANNSIGIQIGEILGWRNDDEVSGSNNTIINNLIGNVSKTNPALENGSHAILVQYGSTLNTIGEVGKGNTIQNKTKTLAAIQIDGATSVQNTIQGNILSCNAGKGIELSNNGNQEYASKTSPNWVTINTAEFRDDMISGKVQTSTGNVTIDIYVSGDCETRCSANESGQITPNAKAQGKTWVKSVSVAGSAGKWEYTLTAADKTAGLTKDNAIVTATDGSGNTSEFSVCEFDPPCTLVTAAAVTATGGKTSICEGDGSITLNVAPTPIDPDNKFEWYKLNETTNKFEIVAGETGTSLTISDKAQNGTYTAFVYNKERDICRRNGDDTLKVAINTNPEDPKLSGDAPAFCKGTGQEKITVTSTEGIKYNWNAANIVSGNETNEVTIDFTTATNPTVVKVTAEDRTTGCTSSEVSISVTINDNPKPSITGDANPSCKATGIEYSVSSSKETSTYTWVIDPAAKASFPSGNKGATVTIDYADVIEKTDFELTVTEVDANGCTGTSDNFEITSCGLKASFTDDGTGKVCIGTSLVNNEITFTNTSKGDISKYSWDFGTDATPTTIEGIGPHTIKYSSAGTKKVQLIVEDLVGNKDTASYDVTVNDLPTKIEFTNTDPTYCDGTGQETLTLTNVQGVSYVWSGSVVKTSNGDEAIVDLSTATNPTKVYVTATDDETKCETKDSLSITISSNPTPKITGESTPLCESKGITYTVTDANEASTYKWTLPDGATIATNNTNSSSITVDFADNNGNIVVEETNKDGCKGKSENFEITLKSCGLKAKFSDDSEGKICINTSIKSNEITFTDQSTGDNIKTWEWDFGTDANPATISEQGPHKVQYTSIGTKKVQLIITDDQGTKDTTSYEVTVNDIPTKLELSNTAPKFCKESVGEEKFSVTEVQGTSYNWTPKANIVAGGTTNEVTMDLSSASSPTNIKVVATDDATGCAVHDSVDVIINETPAPKISGLSKPLCQAQGVVYKIVNPNEKSTYTWTVPDSATFTQAGDSIIVNFASQSGSITVEETNEAGCKGDNGGFEVSLKSCGLKAKFSDNSDGKLCIETSLVKNEIVFTDESSFSDDASEMTWEWDFGTDADPGNIGGQGPHTIKYSSTGTKKVQLILTDAVGTKDTAFYEVVVNDIPNKSDFAIDGKGGCEDDIEKYNLTAVDPEKTNLSDYTYNWNTTDRLLSGQGTTSVDIELDGTSMSGSVAIADKSTECQISLPFEYDVTIKPNLSLWLAGSSSICDGGSQDSYFENDSIYEYHLMSNDTLARLSDIHPEIDSVFITWTLTDKDGKEVTLREEDQEGFYGLQGGPTTSLGVNIKPGYILGIDKDKNEIEFKDYTLNVKIKKTGACADSTDFPVFKRITINKAHKYEFSITGEAKKCNNDSMFIWSELKIDGVDKDSSYTTYNTDPPNKIDQFDYVHNWYLVDVDNKPTVIKDTVVYRAIEKQPVIGQDTAVHYYISTAHIPSTFEITDTIPKLWEKLGTRDTVFTTKEISPIVTDQPIIKYIITPSHLDSGFVITDTTLMKSHMTHKFVGQKTDSVFLIIDHNHLCFKRESKFIDTLVDYAVDRPGAIIGLGSESTGLPDSVSLTLKDVEDVTLQNMHPNSPLVDHQWYWGIVEENDTTFYTDSILDPIAATTTHMPRPIEQVIYKLVTSLKNGACSDSTYANMTNLLYPFVPSAITPNGDGQFDGLVIHNSHNYPEMVVKVFNRWGALVFTSEKGYPEPWAGTRDNGDELPDGTYFYVIEFNDEKIDNFIKEFKDENPYATSRGANSLQAGSVTILR